MPSLSEAPARSGPVRVLIVDDSPVCRDLLASFLSRDPEVVLAGVAVDGSDAVEKVAELRPDVVTMDLKMPVMDGIEATRRIMARTPTPILVLTGFPVQSGRDMTFEAIRAGALDLMVKPDLGNLDEVEKLRGDMTRLIKFLARVEVKRHAHADPPPPAPAEPRRVSAVAIASSAGGPGAVHGILSELPGDFPAGIVLVQHIAEGFARDFASWLDRESALEVRVAQDGDVVRPGAALVAPDEAHLRLMPGGTCRLFRSAPIGGYRPSADVLLSSVARLYGPAACGVILSGMGEDGVAGLADIHGRGGLTFAQDEDTAVVYGMPGVARERGVVDAVLPPSRIATELARLARRGESAGAA